MIIYIVTYYHRVAESALKKGEKMENESKEILQEYIKILALLDDAEDKLATARDRQSEVDLRLLDIIHFIEELPIYCENELTPNQCKELIYMIQDFRMARRGYKREQCLYDTLETHRAKVAYGTQRQMLIAELRKKEKELQTLYKPRKMSYEEIWESITKNTRGKKPKNPFIKEEKKEEEKINETI